MVLHSEFWAQLPLLVLCSADVCELESWTLNNQGSVFIRNIIFNLISVMWIQVIW